MLEKLKLDKPIAFIDVETTGLKTYSDRIVELSILKVSPDGKQEYKSHRVNPGIPIPAEATTIHGITDADVARSITNAGKRVSADYAALLNAGKWEEEV